MQKTRLGFGYDLSPDVNFYMELQYASVWGANGQQGTPVQDNQRTHNGQNCQLRTRLVSGTAASWASEPAIC